MNKEDTLELLNADHTILDENQVNWCEHISRKDNTAIFEICHNIRDIMDRIENEYND